MPRYVDLDNPKIIRGERDRFGLVVYHIPPDTPCLNLAERKQEAIDALEKIIADHPLDGYEDACELITALKAILSTQPELVKESGDLAKDLVKDDTISRKAAIDEIKAVYEWHDVVTEDRMIQHFKALPSAQPERTCVNCGRTVNNGGWYADGGTRCPIEEHYALPKDGYCHLWEKRNVTDDDYPERRTDE